MSKTGKDCFNNVRGAYFEFCALISDVWSVGCILGEMINNKPMFPGKHYLDQICRIQEVLGSPNKQQLDFINNPKAQLYVLSLPERPAVAWEKVYPGCDKR